VSLREYVKCFYNARNAIPYIQNIEIINAFCDGVSNIKTVEEITIKNPKWWSICWQSLTSASRSQRPELGSLNHATKGPQRRRSRKIGRSTQWITGIMMIVGTSSNSLPNKKRKDCSIDLLMLRSGVKSITQRDMVWRCARLF
jgi:hypothetical protein